MYAQEDVTLDVPPVIEAPKADLSELKHTKSGKIDKIIDALTIVLKDGTIVRLASLDLPDFHIRDNAPLSDSALTLLQEKLPERADVMLYQTRNPKKGRVNRMNHQLAHIVIKKDESWLQGLYLANGLARVYTAPTDTSMLSQMYEAEKSARKNKHGLWGKDSNHRILSPKQTPDYIGDFVVIEGTPLNTATVKNNIYLNFGKDWKTDFTVQIPSTLRKKFAKENINALSLAQQPIRVRGYLRDYNGALIELEDTAHLEILQKPTEQPSLAE